MTRTLLVIPLIFFLTTPHYLVLSFHHGFHSYKYGNDFSIIGPVCATIAGILLSSALIKFIMGTFLLLVVSSVIFLVCCIDLLIASLTTSASQTYLYALAATCLAIGMSQPNLVALVWDQYDTVGIIHCMVYVLINMFEICLATVLPLTPKLKYANDIHCPILDCYSLNYLICLILTFIALVILLVLYLLRDDFVMQPLIHKPFMDGNDTQRLKNFISIILPLVAICVFFLLLEHEMFTQSKQLNRIISGISSVNDIQLRIIYYLLTLLCLPIAVLLDKLKLNSFDKIIVGCILICFASFYYGLVNSHIKASFNKFKDGDSRLAAFELVNAYGVDIRYNISPFNKHGICPYAEKIGAFYVNQSNYKMHLEDLTRNHGLQAYNTIGNSSLDPPLHGGLLITYVLFWNQDVVYYERKFRALSGLALLRLIKDRTDPINICLKSSKLVSCGMAERKFMEIPSGRYSIMINETVYGPYFFKNGEYYTFVILNVTNTDLYEIVPFLIIPPFNFSIYWHLLLYILMSLANGLIYAAGLDISSQIGDGDNKVLFINGLYVVYLLGWIIFHIIYDVAEVKLIDKMDFVMFILIGTTLWFYFGYRKNGPLLNHPRVSNEHHEH